MSRVAGHEIRDHVKRLVPPDAYVQDVLRINLVAIGDRARPRSSGRGHLDGAARGELRGPRPAGPVAGG